MIISPIATSSYFILLIIAIYLPTLGHYFTADDFTWFRWAADCSYSQSTCNSTPHIIYQYFFNSEGFFYRPGTKLYFLVMYSIFWLNQVVYHVVSITLHIGVVILLYLVSRKIFNKALSAALATLFFVIASGYLEIVVWTSSTGHLFNAFFIILSFLLFLHWYEKKKLYLLVLSFASSLLSTMFHELGIVAPLLPVAYVLSFQKQKIQALLGIFKDKAYYLLFTPPVLYLIVRIISHSHWQGGDYSYNLLKLPFNAVGNILGYILLSLTGHISYPIYETLRLYLRSNLLVAAVMGALILFAMFYFLKKIGSYLDKEEKNIILFCLLFTVICLLPFIGLGNIAFRYSYLASFGIMMLLSFLVIKMYKLLLYWGRDIALVATGLFIMVFVLFHSIQTQQGIIEWSGAGEKVKNFLTSVDSLYQDTWSQEQFETNFYFVDVPIKNGNAWVFPVGLEDALWFAFENDSIKTIKVRSIDNIPLSVFGEHENWVFKFRSDGSLVKYIMGKYGPMEYEQ